MLSDIKSLEESDSLSEAENFEKNYKISELGKELGKRRIYNPTKKPTFLVFEAFIWNDNISASSKIVKRTIRNR